MKKIKKIQLKDATVMSNDEMKLLFGGSGSSMSGMPYCGYEKIEECSSSFGCQVGNESGYCGWNKFNQCNCKTPSTAVNF